MKRVLAQETLPGQGDGTTQQSWGRANVVCVSYNNRATIAQLLDSLVLESEYIAEVVLHDNGSSDGTVELAMDWQEANPGLNLQVVKASNVGFSGGVYGGSQSLRDTSLPTLCLNPDAILSAGTVRALLSALQGRERVGIATAPLLMTDGSLDPSCVRTLPRFGSALLYAFMRKLVPASMRYNSTKLDDLRMGASAKRGFSYRRIEATTGALMMVNPSFRSASRPIFDLSYWMYGEDLQLCKDAADEGFSVAMIDHAPSIHVKGVSSGWPRSSKSNRAFYDAMYIYFAKNFSIGPVDRALGRFAVTFLFIASEFMGRAERARRALAR